MSATPHVLYEDNHLLILYKPSGWLVQGDHTGDITLIDWGKTYIKNKYDKPGAVFLHACHRLDRPVSGIVIMARTSKALERVNKMFSTNTIDKYYLAVVKRGNYESSATLKHFLLKDNKRNITTAYEKNKQGTKEAILDYNLIAADKTHSLLLIEPKTGRSHQIRVQLAKIGASIQGDLKYGYPEPNPDKSISLHAFRITFVHPVRKKKMTIINKPAWQNFKPQINELDKQIAKLAKKTTKKMEP